MENFEKSPQEQPKERKIIDELLAENPERKNFVLTAIEKFSNPEDIKKFYEEYVEWLKNDGDKNPEDTAHSFIARQLLWFDSKEFRKTIKVWERVLGPHPAYIRQSKKWKKEDK